MKRIAIITAAFALAAGAAQAQDKVKAKGKSTGDMTFFVTSVGKGNGADLGGHFSTAGGDTTCGNGSKSGEGSAIVGHADRQGLKDTWNSKSWNSSHGSRGCSQDQLKASGGAGLLYCFAPN